MFHSIIQNFQEAKWRKQTSSISRTFDTGHFGAIMDALLYEMGITLGGLIFSLMEFRKREV